MLGSPPRMKYECRECTCRAGSTLFMEAMSACAATCPPNTRNMSESAGWRPRYRSSSSFSRSSRSMSSFSDEGTVESCQTARPVCDSPDGHTVRSADAVVGLGVAEAEQWAQLEANPRARQRGQAPDPTRQAAGGDAAEVGTDVAATRQPRTDAKNERAEDQPETDRCTGRSRHGAEQSGACPDQNGGQGRSGPEQQRMGCLLYTSDAADDL